MKSFLKQSLKLFILSLVIVTAFALSIGTAQAQELTIAGSTENSRFSDGSTAFGGFTFDGKSFGGTTTGGELRFEEENNIGTLTLKTGDLENNSGSFTLEILFSLPSGFSANPITVTGEVFTASGEGTFAIIDFPNNPIPVSFFGASGNGVFSVALDDVCLIDGRPCPTETPELTEVERRHKSLDTVASNTTRDNGEAKWLKTSFSPSEFGTKLLANNFLSQDVTITIGITATFRIEIPPTGGLPGGCSRTAAFYRDNPGLIPTDPDFRLNLGTRSYTRDELLAILNAPVQVNGLTRLAQQLIAAKLNIGAGTASPEILKVIADSDALIADLVVRPVGSGFLSLNMVNRLFIPLTRFNEGRVAGSPRCTSNPFPNT